MVFYCQYAAVYLPLSAIVAIICRIEHQKNISEMRGSERKGGMAKMKNIEKKQAKRRNQRKWRHHRRGKAAKIAAAASAAKAKYQLKKGGENSVGNSMKTIVKKKNVMYGGAKTAGRKT